MEKERLCLSMHAQMDTRLPTADTAGKAQKMVTISRRAYVYLARYMALIQISPTIFFSLPLFSVTVQYCILASKEVISQFANDKAKKERLRK
jgi:hypothetical protein